MSALLEQLIAFWPNLPHSLQPSLQHGRSALQCRSNLDSNQHSNLDSNQHCKLYSFIAMLCNAGLALGRLNAL